MRENATNTVFWAVARQSDGKLIRDGSFWDSRKGSNVANRGAEEEGEQQFALDNVLWAGLEGAGADRQSQLRSAFAEGEGSSADFIKLQPS